LGVPGSLRYLRTTYRSLAKHFRHQELRMLTMPSKGFLVGWESDIVLDGDGVCVGTGLV
jgi:hypothetical protein